MKYHGFKPEKFPFYLKELEFRYNHRDRDLYDDLLQVLVGYSQGAVIDQSPIFMRRIIQSLFFLVFPLTPLSETLFNRVIFALKR